MSKRAIFRVLRHARPGQSFAVLAAALLGFAGSAQAQTVTFDAASYTVSEGGGIVQFCLLRTGSLNTRTDGGVYTVTGTATDHPFTGGQDYIPLGGSAGLPPFTFPPGSAQICGSVIILDDNIVEGDETFQVGFEVFSGGVPGTPNIATVTILDNDSLPGAQVFFTQVGGSQPFDEPVYRATEQAVDHGALLAVRCEGSLSQPAVVSFTTEEDTAIDGDDFRRVVAPHTFSPGSCNRTATVRVPLIVDSIIESDESFLVHISVTGGAALHGESTARVVVIDDDTPSTPTVSFEVTGKRRNRHGDFAFGFTQGHGAVPIRVSGRPASSIRVTAMVVDRQDSFTIDAGISVAPWSVNAGIWRPGEAQIYEIQLLSADGAQIGEPSRAIGVVRREGDLEAFGFCVDCEMLYWLYDARFNNTCPDCGESCVLPPYPGQSTSVAESNTFHGAAVRSLDVLRSFRDDVMSQSPAGRFYRNLYGGFSDELFTALLASPPLMFDTLAAQGPWLDGLQALTDGQGSSVVITQSMVDDLEEILAGLKEHGNASLLRVIEMEEARLDVASLVGLDFDQLRDRVESSGGGFTCQPDSRTLCLNDGRFSVQADWTDFDGKSGAGQARSLTGDTGAFWFFDDNNIELVIKVLDGRGLNGNFWVFYGALSDVEYEITVLDTETGRVASYTNPAGTFASRGDTDAIDLGALVSGGFSVRSQEPFALLREMASHAWRGLKRGWSSLLGRSEGVDLLKPRALLDRMRLPTTAGSCVATPTQLCLNNDRFRLEVTWSDFDWQHRSRHGGAADR